MCVCVCVLAGVDTAGTNDMLYLLSLACLIDGWGCEEYVVT